MGILGRTFPALTLLFIAVAVGQAGSYPLQHIDCDKFNTYVQMHAHLLNKSQIAILHLPPSALLAFHQLRAALLFAVAKDLALMLDTQQQPMFDAFLEPNGFDYRLADASAHSLVALSRFRQLSVPEGVSVEGFSLTHHEVGAELLSEACVWRTMFRLTDFARQEFSRHRHALPPLSVPNATYHAWWIEGPVSWVKYRPHAHLEFAAFSPWGACKRFVGTLHEDTTAVYVGSNSFQIKDACARMLRVTTYVDLGLDSGTVGSNNLLLDLVFLVHAESLYHTYTVVGTIAAALAEMSCSRNATKLVHCYRRDKHVLEPPQAPTLPTAAPPDPLHYPQPLLASRLNAVPHRAKGLYDHRFLQQLIYDWQNPPPELCNSSKYHVYLVLHSGIGSSIHTAAAALGAAIMRGKILFPAEFYGRNGHDWRVGANCSNKNILSCYFLPITSCPLSSLAPEFAAQYKVIQEREPWQMSFNNQPGGYCGPYSCISCGPKECVDDRTCRSPQGPFYDQLAALFPRRAPQEAAAALVRYILRPQPWFAAKIAEFHRAQPILGQIPRPWASVHVRWGDKWIESKLLPLTAYMDVLRKQCPRVKHIFLSTETKSVIEQMKQNYTDYSFAYFEQKRIENTTSGFNAMNELMASIANLQVASEADCFVGTLSSNWCRLISEMQWSRSDGGLPYYGLDDPDHDICFPY